VCSCTVQRANLQPAFVQAQPREHWAVKIRLDTCYNREAILQLLQTWREVKVICCGIAVASCGSWKHLHYSNTQQDVPACIRAAGYSLKQSTARRKCLEQSSLLLCPYLLQPCDGCLVNHLDNELQVWHTVLQQVLAAEAHIVLSTAHVVLHTTQHTPQRMKSTVARSTYMNGPLHSWCGFDVCQGSTHPPKRVSRLHSTITLTSSGCCVRLQSRPSSSPTPAGRRRPSRAQSSRTQPSACWCGCSLRGRLVQRCRCC